MTCSQQPCAVKCQKQNKVGREVSRVRRAAAVGERPSQFQDNTSRLPELQQTVLAVGADEVLVGVVGDADHILLVDLEGGGARRE